MKRKMFEMADLYKLVVVCEKHPEGGQLGETYWSNMMGKYGSEFFGGRAATTLKAKWRTLQNEVSKLLSNRECSTGPSGRNFCRSWRTKLTKAKGAKSTPLLMVRDARG
jgi:hypothetical protein